MAIPLIARALVGSALRGGSAPTPPPVRMPGLELEITGIDDVLKLLEQVTPRHANNLMRNTIRSIAADIRKDIRKTAVKRTGTMAKAKNVKLKMRRAIKGAHIAEVYFTSQAFYWRFVEHGTAGIDGSPAQPFVYPARNRAIAALDRNIARNFSRTLEKTIQRELKKQARADR